MTTHVAGLEALRPLVGTTLGWSSWIEIDQQRIGLFAEATGDYQWIHVDPVRAASGPFGHDRRARLSEPVAGSEPVAEMCPERS